jgi:hypothetical protein
MPNKADKVRNILKLADLFSGTEQNILCDEPRRIKHKKSPGNIATRHVQSVPDQLCNSTHSLTLGNCTVS